MAAPRKLVSGLGNNDMPRGWIAQSKTNLRTYYLWKAMLVRTTEKYWEQYPTYTGTSVSEDWLRLSTFVRDIQTIYGYEQWVRSSNHEMMLDKDTKAPGNKHYSVDTCRFITHAESNQDVSKRHPETMEKAHKAWLKNNSRPVIVREKTGDTQLCFPSLKEACRVLGLNMRNAWMVVSDRYPGHKSVQGYVIEYQQCNNNAA